MVSNQECRNQIAEVILQAQLNIRYVLTSCLLYFCNCIFDELYSFSWFSYPRAVVFWGLIAGSLDTLFFSFLLFQEITCAVLVEGGGSQMCGFCWSELQGPYEVLHHFCSLLLSIPKTESFGRHLLTCGSLSG